MNTQLFENTKNACALVVDCLYNNPYFLAESQLLGNQIIETPSPTSAWESSVKCSQFRATLEKMTNLPGLNPVVYLVIVSASAVAKAGINNQHIKSAKSLQLTEALATAHMNKKTLTDIIAQLMT